MKNLYLTTRFFGLLGGVIALFALSFLLPLLFPVAQIGLVVLMAFTLADGLIVFNRKAVVSCKRHLPKVFSLSDKNLISLNFYNQYSLPLYVTAVDEVPPQFQLRNFEIKLTLAPYQDFEVKYDLTPTSRGEYIFRHINLFLRSVLGLLEKRHLAEAPETAIPVYPSILQMKQFELRALSKISTLQGIKRLRRLGHSYEFEQIKNYVRGDDYRSINWKATGRRNELMVNQYEDERSQQIYTILDKSRAMNMPFNDLTLLDYAINTSLVITNIALQKYDRAGLLTFSDTIGTVVKAERNATQLNKILQALYREKERPTESNYELLYRSAHRIIKGRSLIFLFTNFESLSAAERVLPILRRINIAHLLVVIFFENTEIERLADQEANNLEEIYTQTIAKKFLYEKRQIVQRLRQYGIQAILTRPEDLSLHTVNKYLELKARGLI